MVKPPNREILNPGEDRIGLLISVRSQSEAGIVIEHGVDILDIKEPERGSLGRPDVRTVNQILARVDGQCISLALGELVELSTEMLSRFFKKIDANKKIRFAKIGLSKMNGHVDWRPIWEQAIACLPDHVSPVAVAYIDHDESASPTIEQVFESGRQLGCCMAMVDTFDKTAGSFQERDSIENFIHYRQLANSLQMSFVLAGSVGVQTLAMVREIAPQIVGIRGAVCCEQNRESAIDLHALSNFSEALRLPTAAC